MRALEATCTYIHTSEQNSRYNTVSCLVHLEWILENLPFPSSFHSWLLGRRPEFVDPRFVAQGEGRESEW